MVHVHLVPPNICGSCSGLFSLFLWVFQHALCSSGVCWVTSSASVQASDWPMARGHQIRVTPIRGLSLFLKPDIRDLERTGIVSTKWTLYTAPALPPPPVHKSSFALPPLFWDRGSSSTNAVRVKAFLTGNGHQQISGLRSGKRQF